MVCNVFRAFRPIVNRIPRNMLFRAASGVSSFWTPEIISQMHPTKNGDLTPDELLKLHSRTRVWWKCDKGNDHEWETTINSRTSHKTGCPCCAGKKVSVTNSLAAMNPDIAAQWHPTENGDETPETTLNGMYKKVWWKCPNGPDHEWQAMVSNRTSTGKNGCPCCAGQKLSVTNSLAAMSPDVAAQWHPTENGDETPESTINGTHKKAWWKCPNGPDHEWQTTVDSRTSTYKSGCPCCAGRKLSVTNSLAAMSPDIAAQWHPTENGDETPETTLNGPNKKVWWKCPNGPDHEWQAAVNSRTSTDKTGCPYCVNKKVSVTNSLRTICPGMVAIWCLSWGKW